MAQNNSRSMNGDLTAGMTDGGYKKLATRERGGVVEGTTQVARRGMIPENPLEDWYGLVEDPMKVRPDGVPARGR